MVQLLVIYGVKHRHRRRHLRQCNRPLPNTNVSGKLQYLQWTTNIQLMAALIYEFDSNHRTFDMYCLFSEKCWTVMVSAAEATKANEANAESLGNLIKTKRILLKHIEMIIWINRSQTFCFSFFFFLLNLGKFSTFFSSNIQCELYIFIRRAAILLPNYIASISWFIAGHL